MVWKKLKIQQPKASLVMNALSSSNQQTRLQIDYIVILNGVYIHNLWWRNSTITYVLSTHARQIKWYATYCRTHLGIRFNYVCTKFRKKEAEKDVLWCRWTFKLRYIFLKSKFHRIILRHSKNLTFFAKVNYVLFLLKQKWIC